MKIKVGKYYLDKEQTRIVTDESKHLLVVAGAGSGKTLTILGKLKYLIEEKKIDTKEIICISFTAKASEDLKRKIREDIGLCVDVYTFHKLALTILKSESNYEIADAGLLDDIIREYIRHIAPRNEETLKPLLRYFGLKTKKEYKRFIENNEPEINSLERLLSTFIHLFKSNNYSIEDFLEFKRQALVTFSIKKYLREKILLTLAVTIYMRYTTYLEENKEIDFDDMLIKAKRHVDKYGVFHKIKYIIIDEYQDTSLVRFDLVKSILDKTNAHLVAVGDDFQSIYRFTGCDLSLFLDFEKMFPDAKILKIQNTYRNSQQLIEVAGKFVMRNKAQMRKRLRSDKSIAKPIVIKKYTYAKMALTELIYKIYDETFKEIMIIGRNNKDIYFFLDRDKFKIDGDKMMSLDHPEIPIKYMTAHKSKGLESENVILINLVDDTLGFPNQMQDDAILRFVSPHSSKFPFDEERRLFYVALTRTKNKVYLLVPKKEKSVFARELMTKYDNYIEYINEKSDFS